MSLVANRLWVLRKEQQQQLRSRSVYTLLFLFCLIVLIKGRRRAWRGAANVVFLRYEPNRTPGIAFRDSFKKLDLLGFELSGNLPHLSHGRILLRRLLLIFIRDCSRIGFLVCQHLIKECIFVLIQSIPCMSSRRWRFLRVLWCLLYCSQLASRRKKSREFVWRACHSLDIKSRGRNCPGRLRRQNFRA